MANAQGQAQAALNQVNSKIAALTSQINTLQSKIDRSLQSKATRMSDAEQDSIADQIDSLKSQRGDLQEEAARLAEQANPGASDKKLAERQQERASMKQGWDDEVAASNKATKTGNPESRPKTVFSETTTEQSTIVTGGGTTVTKSSSPTPAQEKYYREYKAAQDSDAATNNAQRDEYLRNKGLDSATPAQKRAAIREAREKGDLPPEKEPGSDFKKSNPNPPPGMPSTVTKEAPTDNGTVSERTVERTGASANTAGDAVTAAERPPIVNNQAGTSEDAGTGKDVSSNPTAEPLTDAEKQELKDSQRAAGTNETVVQPVTNPDGSETVVTTDGKDATQSKEGTLQNAGDVLRSGQASSQDKNLVVGETPSNVPARINYTPNPLHDYATYTYSISMHLLTPEAYNDLSDGKEWLPKSKTLIAGGGRWGTDTLNKDTFYRAAQFKDDFYFDGLTVDTIVGMNAQSRATNAYDFKFNIVEPYGFTLINRLLELSIEINQPNYLANPYVMQIDFFGNNDGGETVYPLTDSKGRSITKYLPFKLIEIKIKVGTNGATYACRGIPYNHSAFSNTIATTPANFEITAKTVQDFFTNDSDDAGLQRQSEEKKKQREEVTQVQGNPFLSDANKKVLADPILSSINSPYKTRSYTGAYNAFQQYLKDGQKADHPTTIKFDIDPEIGKSLIVDPELNAATSSPAVDSKDTKEVAAQVNGGRSGKKGTPPSAGFKNEIARFNVNAGDAIVDVINKVMRSSSYVTDQLKEPLKLDAKGNPTNINSQGPIKWFKITPKVKLQNFDARRNQWGLEVTYQIRKYLYHNNKHPAAPMSTQDAIRKNLRKKYSYIYSGANSDIIDFSIDFNNLFYTEVNVLTENTNRTSNSAESQNEAATTEDLKQEGEIEKGLTQQVQHNQIHTTSGDAAGQAGMNATNSPLAQKAADVMKSIYSNARGDMINLKMKIIGDPEFIKTDDIFYNVGNVNAINPEDTQAPDGSLLMDRGDIFVLVTWKTPVDIDYENTGLPDFTKYQYSVFDGVFKVVKVSSEFKSGKFEQNIELIRFHDAVKDPDISKSIDERGGQSKNITVTTADSNTPEADVPEGSVSDVDRARDVENTENTDSNQSTNDKLANVAENGQEKTAEQQNAEANSAKDGTTPNNANAQAQSPQADGGPPVKNEGGSQPQADNPPKIDNNNLPAGVVREPDTGLYTYRGRRFSANDSADLAAKTKAIDDGTTVKTTKTDAESGTKKEVEFNGGRPPPLSKDDQIAEWQADYESARNQAANAQRRLDQANSGLFDDNPFKKQTVIDNNTKLLEAANAKMTALEAQLKARGAAPT
jgi:hypothetical protein